MKSLKSGQLKCYTSKLLNKLSPTKLFILKNYNYLTKNVKLYSQIRTDEITNKSLKQKKIFSELDIQAFKAEVNHLLQKNDHITVYSKLTNMINILLSNDPNNEELIQITDHIILLSDVLRELDRFAESAQKQIEIFYKITNLRESEEVYKLKIKLMDRISFDYLVNEELDEALNWSKNLLELNKERIAQDRLTIIEDKCTLVVNFLNLIQIKIEKKVPSEEIYEDLIYCEKLFNEYRDKMDGLGLKLYKAMGIVHIDLKNLTESNDYLKKCIKYKEAVGDEFDDESYFIYKSIGENYLGLEYKDKSFEYFDKCLQIKEEELKFMSHDEYQYAGKNICIDIARIYEIKAEYCLNSLDTQHCEENVTKAFDYYLKFPLEGIYMAKSYLIKSDLLIEKKEYTTCIEYLKKYLEAFEKYEKENSSNKKLNLLQFTTVTSDNHLSNLYKVYRLLTQCYESLDNKQNLQKYGQMAINQLIEINNNNELNDSENDLELSDYLNMKYEIIKIYEMMKANALILKECDEAIKRINNFSKEALDLNNDNKSTLFNKNYFIFDIYNIKVDTYIRLEKYNEAKNLISKCFELIHVKNLEVDEEKLEEINGKLKIINLKIKLQLDKVK